MFVKKLPDTLPFQTPYQRLEHPGVSFISDPKDPLFIENNRTKQNFRDECDINVLMKKYERNPDVLAELVRQNPGLYDDFSESLDYQSAMEVVATAHSQFHGLDASIRARFDNDPSLFLDFVSDDANLPALKEFGIAEFMPPKAPVASPEATGPGSRGGPPAKEPKAPKQPAGRIDSEDGA